MHQASYVILGLTALALAMGWAYLRRCQITRPPAGVMNLVDVGLLFGALILIPVLYLALPGWLAVSLLSAALLGVLYFTLEPVLRNVWANWLAALTLLSANIGDFLIFGSESVPHLAINNALLLIAAVGVANLWAQSGTKARDLAVLAGALSLYDFIATLKLILMEDMISQLADTALAPQVAWNVGGNGLG